MLAWTQLWWEAMELADK